MPNDFFRWEEGGALGELIFFFTFFFLSLESSEWVLTCNKQSITAGLARFHYPINVHSTTALVTTLSGARNTTVSCSRKVDLIQSDTPRAVTDWSRKQ